MSVNNNNGPEIGDNDLESVEFESQQLLRDIEKEFETLKEQEAAFTNAEDTEKEEVSSKKSEWMWNLAAIVVFALIGVLGEKAYRVISTKKVEIPEHLESLQEEEDFFSEDSSRSEKAMHLRNALQAQKVQNDDEVNRMMDEELDSYHEVPETEVVHIDTKKAVEVEETTEPVVKEQAPEVFAQVQGEEVSKPLEKTVEEPKPVKKVAKPKPVKKVAKLKPVKKSS